MNKMKDSNHWTLVLHWVVLQLLHVCAFIQTTEVFGRIGTFQFFRYLSSGTPGKLKAKSLHEQHICGHSRLVENYYTRHFRQCASNKIKRLFLIRFYTLRCGNYNFRMRPTVAPRRQFLSRNVKRS